MDLPGPTSTSAPGAAVKGAWGIAYRAQLADCITDCLSNKATHCKVDVVLGHLDTEPLGL